MPWKSAGGPNIAGMSSEPLLETLNSLRNQVPDALQPVLDAFSDDSEDGPEDAWQRLVKETLDES